MTKTARTVLITGGAAGIGAATARAFADAGDRVVVWDVASDEALAQAASALGEGASAERVDVTDGAAVDAAMERLIERHGRLDVLINNAGITRDARLIKMRDGEVVGRMEEADFERVVDVNLKGVFLCTRAAAPHMVRQGGGVVLNASSVVGLYGNFGQTNYAATKGGVITMTQTWARELGRSGIRVNAVAPGFIATEMVLSIPEKVRERMVAATPLGRLGTPDDIAQAYLWLASDAASYVHGTVLSVDGGLVPGT
ncbi:MAG: glucose 1-dehydrogenase [Acidobacteriota bacterium]